MAGRTLPAAATAGPTMFEAALGAPSPDMRWFKAPPIAPINPLCSDTGAGSCWATILSIGSGRGAVGSFATSIVGRPPVSWPREGADF